MFFGEGVFKFAVVFLIEGLVVLLQKKGMIHTI